MGLIDKLIGGGIKGLADSAAGIIDSINAPKEAREEAKLKLEQEVNRHQEALSSQAVEIEKAYLADVQNARDSNAKIQGDKPSWMAKNLAYLIDAFVTILWGALTTYLMAVMLHLAPKTVGVDYTAVTAVWGAVSATFATILNFHRGTSRGSEDKQKTLDKMIQGHR